MFHARCPGLSLSRDAFSRSHGYDRFVVALGPYTIIIIIFIIISIIIIIIITTTTTSTATYKLIVPSFNVILAFFS